MARSSRTPAGILAPNQGSTRVLPNGNVFVGWGAAPVFSEFAPDGRLLFNGRLTKGKGNYRAVRHEWTGRPGTPPAVGRASARDAAACSVYGELERRDRGRALGGARRARARPAGGVASARARAASRRPIAARTRRAPRRGAGHGRLGRGARHVAGDPCGAEPAEPSRIARVWLQREITLRPQPRGFHLVTREVAEALPELAELRVGLAAPVHPPHLGVADAQRERLARRPRATSRRWFDDAVPEDAPYWTHTIEGPDDMPAHIKASLLGPSLSLPVSGGRLALGTWQGDLPVRAPRPRRRALAARDAVGGGA